LLLRRVIHMLPFDICSYASAYAGSDYPVMASVDSEQISSEGLSNSVQLNLPPLATLFYRLQSK